MCSKFPTRSRAGFRVMSAVLTGGIFLMLALLHSLVAPVYLLASVVPSCAATIGLCADVFHGAGWVGTPRV